MKQFEETLLKGQIQSRLPKNYIIRPLESNDYEKSYLELLAQLTIVGNVTKEQFNEQFKKSINSGKYYVVIESKNRIIGAGSIQLENKFIHDLGLVGHIEDIVVADSERGLGLGKLIIEQLIELGETLMCYKVILSCAEKNIGFYEKCGLVPKEITMAKYFNK